MYVSPIVHAHQLHSCITCKVIQSKDKLKTAKYHPVCKWPIVIISKFEQQSQRAYIKLAVRISLIVNTCSYTHI